MRKIKYVASADFWEKYEIEVDDNMTDDQIISHLLNHLQDTYYIVEVTEVNKDGTEKIIS